MKTSRAFTIAETLVVVFIIGMLLTAVAGAMLPLLHAPGATEAKYDTIVPATTGLFVLERDIRQSDANGVFSCTIRPVACGGGSLVDHTAAIAVATAVSSADLGAPFVTSTTDGTPVWQGFLVYWQPDGSGTVYRAFESEPGMAASIDAPDRSEMQSLAETAVEAATGDSGGGVSGGGGGGGGGGGPILAAVAMRDVASFSATVDLPDDDVTLHIVTTSASGDRSNTSTFDTDVFTRN